VLRKRSKQICNLRYTKMRKERFAPKCLRFSGARQRCRRSWPAATPRRSSAGRPSLGLARSAPTRPPWGLSLCPPKKNQGKKRRRKQTKIEGKSEWKNLKWRLQSKVAMGNKDLRIYTSGRKGVGNEKEVSTKIGIVQTRRWREGKRQ